MKLRPGVALCACLLVGCSWTQMQRLPAGPEIPADAKCTEARTLPIIDTALAVWGLAATVAGAFVLARCGDDTAQGCGTAAIGIVYPIGTALFTWSAVKGYKAARACKAFHARTPAPVEATPVAD
jgi:hypothetical protein